MSLVLEKPRWAGSALGAALVTLAVCWPAWPGFMSYDSLHALRQARSGVETMTWPPLHAYLFRLSDAVGAGPGAVFAGQVFLLFLSAALVLDMLVPRLLWAKLAFAGFVLSFVYFPAQLGVAQAQWRDVPTASFAVAAAALWLMAQRRPSAWLLAAAIVIAAAAVALRYNAFVLVGPLFLLMLWRPLGRSGDLRGRTVAVSAMVASLALAAASTHWRLPDLKPLPPTQGFAGTQLFDLIGVSACADRNYIPLAVSADRPLTPYQIRRRYDPRHLLNTLRDRPGAPPMVETDAGGEVQRQWREVVPRAFGCYLAHRSLVMTEQMGMAREGVFYPTHGGVDPNPYGLRLAHPAAAKAVSAYVERNAADLWRRPILLYVLMLGALAVAFAARVPGRLFLLALALGALAYPALLFVAAPAADARYIFPSNVLCQLIVAVVGGVLLSRRLEARR